MLEIITIPVTPLQQNARLLIDSETGDAAVVDPGGDADVILAEIQKRKTKCGQLWLTHSHFDHCGGVAGLQRRLGATLYAHKAEQQMRENVLQIAQMFGVPPQGMENCPEPSVYLAGGGGAKGRIDLL